jgi:hypothetical protein|nr:MAG TPA: hypothetical protein [Caudoviricetes sp.]
MINYQLIATEPSGRVLCSYSINEESLLNEHGLQNTVKDLYKLVRSKIDCNERNPEDITYFFFETPDRDDYNQSKLLISWKGDLNKKLPNIRKNNQKYYEVYEQNFLKINDEYKLSVVKQKFKCLYLLKEIQIKSVSLLNLSDNNICTYADLETWVFCSDYPWDETHTILNKFFREWTKDSDDDPVSDITISIMDLGIVGKDEKDEDTDYRYYQVTIIY